MKIKIFDRAILANTFGISFFHIHFDILQLVLRGKIQQKYTSYLINKVTVHVFVCLSVTFYPIKMANFECAV